MRKIDSSLDFLNILSNEFKLPLPLIKSRYDKRSFYDLNTWHQFFHDNLYFIKAKPFVKWVGWKRQIIDKLIKYMPPSFNNYFEPFVWWWAMFFNIQKEWSILSDINVELINTYNIIKDNPSKLINFLKTLDYNLESYNTIRSWDRESNFEDKYNICKRAWRFIYLNRTCFNWLHRVNSKWHFNVPMGKYTNPDFIQEENILAVSKLLNELNVKIIVQGFEDILKYAKTWDLIYFDPPYDTLSPTANFTNYNKESFGINMQIRLNKVFELLDGMWCKIMLSNHNTPLINELYKQFNIHIISARRNINRNSSWRGLVEEVIITNY